METSIVKRLLTNITIASCALCAWGNPGSDTESDPVMRVSPQGNLLESAAAYETEDVVLIKDDMLPEGGTLTTYLSDMIVANISSYGVAWYEDSGLAMFVYRTDSEDVYVKNLSTYSDTWVKGYAEEGSIWIPTGQPIMVSNKGSVYRLVTAVVDMNTNQMETRAGIRFYVDDDGKSLVMEESPDDSHVLGFYTMVVEKGSISQAFSRIHLSELEVSPVSPPQEAEFRRYEYTAMLGGYQPWENRSWIAFDGNDVYVQGLEWIYPEGWVKGTLMNDGSIRIPTGQFLGLNGNYAYYYLAAEYDGDITGNADVRAKNAFFLDYDASTDGYQISDGECFFAGQDMAYGFPVIDSRFTPFPVTAAMPSQAEDLDWAADKSQFRFHIPMTDTDGAFIDRYLLSYRIIANGKDYTFPPCGLTQFEERTMLSANASYPLDEECNWGWNQGDLYIIPIESSEEISSLGVILRYDVLGEINESPVSLIATSSVKEVSASERKPVAYYAPDGRRLSRPNGICIARYSDGTSAKIAINN